MNASQLIAATVRGVALGALGLILGVEGSDFVWFLIAFIVLLASNDYLHKNQDH